MPYYFSRSERMNDVGAALVGTMDIVSGLVVYFSLGFSFSSNSFVLFLCLFYFCLGIWSLATNFLRRNYYDWKGYIDVINALCLIFIFSGITHSIFRILGMVIIAKGILSLFLITTKEH